MTDSIAASPPLPIAPPRLTVFDTGSESCPQGQLPVAIEFSVDEAKHALNPLQYVPGVGMLYRQATGETIPPAASIFGSVVTSAAFGGPMGIVGTLAMNFLQEVLMLKPDTSRPAVPEGMQVTGSEQGVQPVSPGSITTPNGYTTLATTLPDFLGGTGAATQFAGPDQSPTPVRMALAAYEGTMVGPG